MCFIHCIIRVWLVLIYICRIRVTVGAGNLLDSAEVVDYTRTTNVDIFVQDVNNNEPQFPRNYSTAIQENIRPGESAASTNLTDSVQLYY